MKKRTVAIILNILIIIFEIIGFVITYNNNHRIAVEYYTEDSNLLALITSTIFVIYLLFNKKIPRYLKMLKYISTICLTITFLVVIFILAPMLNFNYNYLLFQDELLYHHLICPILCIITFIYFDNLEKFTIKENIISLFATILYGVVIVTLNILKIVDGPYPFLRVNNQSVVISVIWIIVLLALAYAIALLLRKIHHKTNKGQ